MGFLASRDGEALTSKVLAKTYGTSPVVLRRVLVKLKAAGLVQTKRGVGGGSVLARDATTITVREVYEAVSEGSRLLPEFSKAGSGRVAPILADFVDELLADAEETLLEKLEGATVADMDRHVRGRSEAALGCDLRV